MYDGYTSNALKLDEEVEVDEVEDVGEGEGGRVSVMSVQANKAHEGLTRKGFEYIRKEEIGNRK